MKFMKRLTAAALAALMLAGTVAALPAVVSAEEAPATYSGTPITEHKGGYDYPFSRRSLVTYSYDFSLERINFYASDPAIALGRTSGEIVDGKLIDVAR